MRHSLVALIVVFTAVQLSSAGDWAQFRGADNAAFSTDTGLPREWSSTKNIAWKSALPGYGASSPIIVGDRVFLTCWSGYGFDAKEPGDRSKLMQHVVCLDQATGKLLWDKARPASDGEQEMTQRVAEHGYATPTPCSDGEAVYAYFGVSGLVAYSLDGELLWSAQTGSKTAGFGCAASPILFQELVIQNASIEAGTLFAFDKRTGKEVWKVDEIRSAWTTPTLVDLPDGATELIINQKDWIYGLDPLTGEQLWKCSGIDDYVVPCVVAHDGIAYCLGGRQNRAVAVRCGGRGDVSESHKLWQVTIGANVTSPIYLDGKLYWASDRGVANCLDAATGEKLLQERIPTRARIYASAVYGDGHLYVTTRDAGIIVLEAKPEYREVATNVFEDDPHLLNATPAIANGRLYVRTNGWLYAIGK